MAHLHGLIKRDSYEVNLDGRPRGIVNPTGQAGYGAFPSSHSQIDSVVKYIMNQEKHHKKKTFGQEYLELLHGFNIEYDERYILKDIGE